MEILLTENNVLDVYIKLRDKENVTQDELEQVRKRFHELLDYKR